MTVAESQLSPGRQDWGWVPAQDRQSVDAHSRCAADARPARVLVHPTWERRARERLAAWEQRDQQWDTARGNYLDAVMRVADAATKPGRRLSVLVGCLGGLLALVGLAMCMRRLTWPAPAAQIGWWAFVLATGMLVSAVCLAQARVIVRIREAKIAELLGCAPGDFQKLDWADPKARERHARLRSVVEFNAEPQGVAASLTMRVRDPREVPEGPLRELAREWAHFNPS